MVRLAFGCQKIKTIYMYLYLKICNKIRYLPFSNYISAKGTVCCKIFNPYFYFRHKKKLYQKSI